MGVLHVYLQGGAIHSQGFRTKLAGVLTKINHVGVVARRLAQQGSSGQWTRAQTGQEEPRIEV